MSSTRRAYYAQSEVRGDPGGLDRGNVGSYHLYLWILICKVARKVSYDDYTGIGSIENVHGPEAL